MTDDRSPFALSPWVRRLLAANGAVYLLQLTVFTSPWLAETFGFAAAEALRRPWTLLTYAFLHGSLLHLFGNMLGLVVFGPQVERRYGGAYFLRLYVVAALGGALLSVALLPLTGSQLIIGASGAVFGVMMAFVLTWPDHPVYVFPLPVPIRARWLVVGFAAFSLIAGIRGLDRGVAHFAHLGGFLAAWLYVLASRRLAPRRPVRPAPPAPAVLVHPQAGEMARRASAQQGPSAPRHSPEAAVRAEVDRLLDKISQRGMGSLTPDERRFLESLRAKER